VTRQTISTATPAGQRSKEREELKVKSKIFNPMFNYKDAELKKLNLPP
jgi:hypothetical protein